MPDPTNATPRPPADSNGSNPAPIDPATGAALRSVYQRTVEELVPDDLLDLLGKLS